MIDDFQILSINHLDSSAEQRAAYGLSRIDNLELTTRIAQSKAFSWFSVLYTSNRIEFHLISKHRNPSSIMNELSQYLAFTDKTLADSIVHSFKHYSGITAIKHLLRVSCGIDSEKVGEKHITAQIRRAYNESMKFQHNDFIHLLQNYIARQEKTIRKLSGLNKEYKSEAGIILELIKEVVKYPNILFINLNRITNTLAIKIAEKGITSFSIFINNSEQSYSPELANYLIPNLNDCPKGTNVIIISSDYNISDAFSIKPELIVNLSESELFSYSNCKTINKSYIDSIVLDTKAELIKSKEIAENIISDLPIDHQIFVS